MIPPETVTVRFYMAGHGVGQYVAKRADAEIFLRLIHDELVSATIIPGEHRGMEPVPGTEIRNGGMSDHYL